jgi:hypothetical protein
MIGYIYKSMAITIARVANKRTTPAAHGMAESLDTGGGRLS